jgi:hypothetical protein
MMVNLPIGDPYEVYRMNRLLKLGSRGAYAVRLDNAAAEVQGDLSPEQVAKAQAWAQHEFDSYFANSPQLDAMPSVCEDPLLSDK